MVKKLKLNNKFISFEGIDGSGKTTLIKELTKILDDLGEKYIVTREPGGADLPFAEAIRKLIFDSHNINSRTELLLFEASRSEHVQKIIIPNLEAKKLVISDRFADSSIVYQGHKNLDKIWIERINDFATNQFYPSLTFLFDLEPEIAFKRMNKEARSKTRFDKELLIFHQQIRKKYLQLAKENQERFVIIDASRDQKTILAEIWNILKEKLEI